MRTICILLTCIAASACQDRELSELLQENSSRPDAKIYRNTDNSSEWIFDGDAMIMRPIKEARDGMETVGGLRDDYTWDVHTEQCSDSVFICLQAERFSFVVPKGARRVGDHYVKNGLRFTVEACEGWRCTTARIRADCDAFIDARCIPASDGRSIGVNPVMTTYFVHQRDHGVISLGVTYDQPLEAEGSGVAAEYRLIGPRGILSS